MYPGQRAHLLAIAGSERKTNYIIQLLKNQTRELRHRWTKIPSDPRFPAKDEEEEKETPIFALGATKPLLAKCQDFYTTVLSGWAPQLAQAFQQMTHTLDPNSNQFDNFLQDAINAKVGSPYPTLAGNFGK